MKRENMLAEVTGLVGGEDLKSNLARSWRKRCLSLKETRLARVFQIEFVRNPIADNPLSSYFEFV
jgi:hypothetical protein